MKNMNHTSQSLGNMIAFNMPHLSVQQIHLLCRKQEKNVIFYLFQVMEKINEVKHIDLYQEIANVCPMHRDLKNMSSEEVAIKINHYTSKMALMERNSDKSS
jgi:hypothetical protein